MRRGLVIAGVVVLALGAIVMVYTLVGPGQSTVIPVAPNGLLITPNVIGSGTVTVTWSSAPSNFHVTAYQCPNAACSSLGAIVAQSSGPSGSISFSANAGQTFAIVGQQNTNAVGATIAVSGLTPGLLVGLVVAVIGAVLAGVGSVLKPKPRPVLAEESEPEPEPFSTKPFRGTLEGSSASSTAPTPPPMIEDHPEVTGPVYFDQGGPQEVYSAPPPTAASTPSKGPRPLVKCSHCGTMNESWILNCRQCRRPMSTTG